MKLRKLVATLSAISIVGGVAAISYSALSAERAAMWENAELLPAAQLLWSETKTVTAPVAKIKTGSFLGTLEIPSTQLNLNVFQGTDSKTLKKGVGHYVKSVMPGVANNSVLSGHRDTVFRTLGEVKIGALIFVTVESGTFTYQVTKIRIVGKNDRTVIVPTTKAQLTLSTCYPFRFIGSAPQRYVVIAHLYM
jgi:sortase A